MVKAAPGIVLLFLVGYAGKFTEQWLAAYGKAHQLTLPNIEYVLWAIVFGLIVSNTVGLPAIFRAVMTSVNMTMPPTLPVPSCQGWMAHWFHSR